jgi:hypothetical protein
VEFPMKAKRRPTPYWTRVIAQARERKKKGLPAFTEAQKGLAGSWVTCACGKQDPRIPRIGPGKPFDSILSMLGGEFDAAVALGDDPDMAAQLLHRIEQRAAEVLAEVERA